MRLSTSAGIALVASLLVNPGVHALRTPATLGHAGGALSEWVTALGGESKLVGVDTTSQHPASPGGLPSIGYQRCSCRPKAFSACARKSSWAPRKVGLTAGAGYVFAAPACRWICSRPSRICPHSKATFEHLGKLLAVVRLRLMPCLPGMNRRWHSRTGWPRPRLRKRLHACCCC